MPRLQKIIKKDNREVFTLTMPVQIIRAKGWQKGDEIDMTMDKQGNLVLRRKNNDNQTPKTKETQPTAATA